eukprot:COSAG01_NODE_1619_length_9715_cov_29.912958_4_plen_54_part_00
MGPRPATKTGMAEAKRAYEDTLQRVHEAHGEAPLPHEGNENNFFARQLSKLGA